MLPRSTEIQPQSLRFVPPQNPTKKTRASNLRGQSPNTWGNTSFDFFPFEEIEADATVTPLRRLGCGGLGEIIPELAPAPRQNFQAVPEPPSVCPHLCPCDPSSLRKTRGKGLHETWPSVVAKISHVANLVGMSCTRWLLRVPEEYAMSA